MFRRLFGSETDRDHVQAEPANQDELDAEERQHELDVLRSEQERLDELTIRQLRYAKYAWQPPAQGGERRADDHDATGGQP
jgi:hypothetical protein